MNLIWFICSSFYDFELDMEEFYELERQFNIYFHFDPYQQYM